MPVPISVIIPVWNHTSETQECLTRLRYNSSRGEVIVVDNGSTDDTPWIIKKKFPLVKYLRYEEALGFPKAINIGLKEAQFDYVILLNNDAYPMANFWQNVYDALAKYPQAVIGQTGGISRIDGRLREIIASGQGEPTYIEGYFMLFPKKIVEEIGLFDEGFSPAYYEDCDFSIRAKLAGYPLILIPSFVIHKRGITTADLVNRSSLVEHNRIYFLHKWEDTLKDPQKIKLLNLDNLQREPQEKIIVRRSGAFGDVLMAMTAFQEFKSANPSAHFATSSSCQDLAEIYLEPSSLIRVKSDTDFRLLIDLDGVYESAWKEGRNIPILESFCRKLECKTPKRYIRPHINPQLSEKAKTLLAKIKGPRIAVGFSSLRKATTWQSSSLVQVFKLLPEYNFLLFNGTSLQNARMNGNPLELVGDNVFDFCNQTNIPELVALVNECDGVLSIDTLLSHLGSSLNKPIVLVSANPLTIPPGKVVVFLGNSPCYPCLPTNNDVKCPSEHCLDWVPPNAVASILENIL